MVPLDKSCANPNCAESDIPDSARSHRGFRPRLADGRLYSCADRRRTGHCPWPRHAINSRPNLFRSGYAADRGFMRSTSWSAAADGPNVKTLFGSANASLYANPTCSIPRTDAARVRAIFVHPAVARRRVWVALILCSRRSRSAGRRLSPFRNGAVQRLTGFPLLHRLRRLRWQVERVTVPHAERRSQIPVVRMIKVPQASPKHSSTPATLKPLIPCINPAPPDKVSAEAFPAPIPWVPFLKRPPQQVFRVNEHPKRSP